MKIPCTSITMLASEGRITLQIPEYMISFGGATENYENTEFEYEPDDSFIFLKNSRTLQIATGREQGFMFLSRKGWKANKHRLKEAFESACAQGRGRGTWEDFEKHAEEFYKGIQKRANKDIATFEKKIEQIRKARANV